MAIAQRKRIRTGSLDNAMPGPYDAQYAGIRQKIAFYAQKWGIDPDLAIWQLWAENKFRNTGCSHANACGIAQFIPETARDYGVNVYDVDSSLDGYGKYMAYLKRLFGGDMTKAVAAYNWGEGRVQKLGLDRAPAETRNYLASIGSGLRSIGKSIISPAWGAYDTFGGSGSMVGDVLGLGSLRGWLFDERIASGPERFQPFLDQAKKRDPANRLMLATAVLVIVVLFVWREF